MQDAVGFSNTFNCKFTMESSGEKNFLNRLRFDRIMVVSVAPLFWSTLYICVLATEIASPLEPIVSAHLCYVWTIACVKVRISSITAT